MTRRYALLGDPVAHSLSPILHGAAFETWGVDATYELRRVDASSFDAAIRDAALSGGNITLPHKRLAKAALDTPSADVIATGACNCWVREATGELRGDNTDVAGLRSALREAGWLTPFDRVLLLGAGGAARAAVRVLAEAGVGRIAVWNRTRAAAERLAAETAVELEVLDQPRGVFDLVVNATSLGLRPSDALPLALEDVTVSAAYDLVYAPGETAWVRHARGRGIPARDGLGMLVDQAAASLRFWFPDREPPRAAMWAAAERALAGA